MNKTRPMTSSRIGGRITVHEKEVSPPSHRNATTVSETKGIGRRRHSCRRLPPAKDSDLRDILVVVRGIAVGLSASDCFRGGGTGGPRRCVDLQQSAYGVTPTLSCC